MLHLVTSDDEAATRSLADAYSDATRATLCIHRAASDEERDSLLQHALACVAPSLEEGYGYSIVEASLNGAPVIASLIPAHLETGLGRDVTYFSPGDVQGLLGELTAKSTSTRRRAPVGLNDQVESIQRRTGIATIVQLASEQRKPAHQ
jgi:glycosyltransferase involved in cell wall biosynthesis